MGESTTQHYVNPLTVEAQFFLDSMQSYGKSCNQIDIGLYTLLERIVVSIDEFLGQKLVPIVNTEKTKLVVPKEIGNIKRIYHCNLCKTDLGKTAEKAAVHLADRHERKNRKDLRKEKRKAEQEKRATKILKLPKKTMALINSDLNSFFLENLIIAEKLKEIPDYGTIEKELLQLIEPLFPQQTVKLYKFGSRISGIGTKNSDLDIFVDIGKTFNDFENRASPKTLENLISVRKALQKNPKDWLNLTSIEKARVPIIRVLNAKTRIECDIGFSNSLGYCNTKLLEYLFDLQPMARRMSIFLKKWIERTRLSEFITTYAINLMIIYLLQIKKHLPSVQELQLATEKNMNVGPWIGNFSQKKLSAFNMEQIVVNTKSYKKFMHLFFDFYAGFNYGLLVVCPYFGRETEISKIEKELPKRYSDYVSNSGGETKKECGLELNKPVVVQDPIQLNHNVWKGSYPLKMLVDYFRQSADAFAAI